jgi:hypothetical protein
MNAFIDKYYQICSIVDDDTWRACHVIRSFHKRDIKFSKILKHVEELNFNGFEDTIDDILDQNIETIKRAGDGLVFKSEGHYIAYLSSLLRDNRIPFVPFTRIGDVEHCNQGD